MKTPSWKIYSIIKDLTKTNSTLREPTSTDPSLILQNINLEPIFDTQTHLFKGVFCQSFLNCEIDELENLFQECLGNLSYWHCHNRAIRCIVPIRAEHISCPTTHQSICRWISQSDLPVGLLVIAICDLKTDSYLQSELEQFKRLGLEIELFEFTGQEAEFEWLNHFTFDGIHLSLRFVRSIHQSPEQKALLDKTLIYQKAHKFHLYFRGIALVHDFIFAKNYGIHFCYGPLMMPAISKHQILKIKESQFANMPSISTPLTHYQDGDPK